jgi:hypothetical protein
MCSYITGEIIRVDGGTRFPHLWLWTNINVYHTAKSFKMK